MRAREGRAQRCICVASIALCLSSAPALAAAQDAQGTSTVEPGAQYRASWLHRLLFGSQWREEWATGVAIPTLDLETFDGGLTPIKRGGGRQTRSLHFRSANGRRWSFRSVDKDEKRPLAPDLRESLVGDVLQDLASRFHPGAAFVVAPLLDTVDVLHATPELVRMPDDGRLGPFRDFAGVVGMIEERPERGFAGSDKALGTFELFSRLDARSDEIVDAREYLRARLIDIFVGDSDRGVDQWRWVRVEGEDERVWRPVPRDRDQAFARLDGIIVTIAGYYTGQVSGFGPTYPSIEKLTYTGRYIDRRFLVPLEKREWDAVTAEVVAQLTNAAISDAVHHLPPELYAKSGPRLEETLRARRDGLTKASESFYRLLADRVDVHGTEGADQASIQRSADGSVAITLQRLDEATGEAVAAPFFHRSFHPSQTSEVRLYLLGGADRVLEEGATERKIRVRIVRGRLADVGGHGTPPATKIASAGPGFVAPTHSGASDSEDALRARYERFRDWGSDVVFFPQLSFDSTRGLVPGARVELTRYGFGLDPFADQMNFAAAWSTGLNEPRLEYSADIRTPSPVRGRFYAAYSGMELANFFGLGNESTRDRADSYYTVKQRRLVLHPIVETALLGPLRGRAGLALERLSEESAGIVAASGVYGFGNMSMASTELGLSLDTRSGLLTRQRGVSLDIVGRYYPPLLDNEAAFTKARAEASALVGTDRLPAVLGLRVAGEKNWGRYPVVEAAFLGGAPSQSSLDVPGASIGNPLRGYPLNRFAGDASVVANAELQVALGKYNAILPLSYGLLGIADVGRVFLAGESSKRWHSGAGGGLWLALRADSPDFKFLSTMSFSVVRSDEGRAFYFTTGSNL